jgi:hypothetical protein
MKYYDKLVKQIKRLIPRGKKVYLDGGCQTDKCYYLWWYVHKEGGVLWVEYERDDWPYGRTAQQASDLCDEDMLESILQAMTVTTVPDTFPVGATNFNINNTKINKTTI